MTLYLNDAETKLIGLDEIIAQCRCRSPQGHRLKANHHFYAPAEKNRLQEEFDAIERLMALLKAAPTQAIDAQRLLSQCRDLRATMHGLESERLLDETEFFELKRAIAIFNQLADLKELIEAAKVQFAVLVEAQHLLDPAGSGVQGFHIYSAYSAKLSQIRKNKRELEILLETASREARQDLLQKRNLVNAEEDAEEERVRRELGIRLLHWLPELHSDLEACALLDFRLARAELALKWQAQKPELATADEPAEIREAWHPMVQASLKKTGATFTPHSIRIDKGSTVITGANMGGKSVALQTCFLTLALTQLGYFPPCKALKTPLYEFLSFSAGESGDFNLGLSAFGMEAIRIRDDFRRSQSKRGLVVMDEPCRGTNPSEATAIIQVLCQAYGSSHSSLLIATHYKVTPGQGLRFYRIKGIRQSGTESLRSGSGLQDSELIRQIQQLMDFQLEEADGAQNHPSAAIQIAQLLGVDPDLIQAMQKLWQEEKWLK
jgi:DNA mismatch repair protein MutS2